MALNFWHGKLKKMSPKGDIKLTEIANISLKGKRKI